MRGLIAKAMALPLPGKAMIGMVLAGGIYGVFTLIGMNQLGFMLGVAMAALTFVLALFAFVMEKRDKRKAGDVEASIAESASSTPTGVNKVADRAKLDDLRRQFEGGVQTFRDYGKNLYDMPWYVVVGEPGSGKTEAIRHSGIGFPPGLQDQLQGTGGTVNMNWWFTDQAVVLDTAGRLMFEDVAPGDTNEWREFLKLLRTSRPNCPINGMLLVIPADTLIADKPDEIEKKAGKIAQQFDQIQRSLGVRFPVFVLITKSDLINGFREFFDDITDPRLTAQMLGWSNPKELDDPFKPDQVEEHLGSVRDHLLQRRFSLLQDPIHSEDPKGRRIDQVDALYKFPDAITEIAPRLRRYLEMIFVAGEWSQKPLFLRGIYFTSSMRDGDALDADLAEVLGVGVGALPEGKLWERERSYFLRDVFVDKVFKERGLVTRAANAGQVKRKRALLMTGAAAAASVLLGGMIWYSYTQTKQRIQNPRDFWVATRGVVEKIGADASGAGRTPAGAVRHYLSPIAATGSKRKLDAAAVVGSGNEQLKLDGQGVTYLEFFDRAQRYFDENSSSTGLFALVAALPGGGKDVFKRQLPTQRLLFEQLVLVRAAELAREDILDKGRDRAVPIGWGAGDLGPATLGSLISFEVASTMGGVGPLAGDSVADLVRFAVASDEEAAVPAEAMAELVSYYDWLYGDGSAWPPATVLAGSEKSISAVTEGLASFNERWRDPRGEGTLFGNLRTLNEASIGLSGAEERLVEVSRRLGLTTDVAAYEMIVQEWVAEYAAYENAYRMFDSAFVAVSDEFNGEVFRNSNIAEEARLAVWGSAKASYDGLLERFGDDTARQKLDPEKEADARLIAWRESLIGAMGEAETAYREKAQTLVSGILTTVVPSHLSMRGGSRLYARRKSMFDGARAALATPVPTDAELAGAIEAIDRSAAQQNRDLALDRESASGQAVLAVVNAAARRARYGAIRSETDRLQGWEEILSRGGTPALPVIPLSRLDSLDYLPKYNPENNLSLLASFQSLRDLANKQTTDGDAYVLDAAGVEESIAVLEAGLQPHLDDYERFWVERVPGALEVRPDANRSWGEMGSTLMTSNRTMEAFEALREVMSRALSYAGPDADARVTKLRTAVEEEMGDAALRSTIQNTLLAEWGALSSNSSEAGETIRRSAEAKSVMNRFFPLEPVIGTPGPEELYWNSFVLAAIGKIADDSAGTEERAILGVESDCSRFPLTLDASAEGGLTHARVEMIADVLGRVGVLTSTEAIVGNERPFAGIPNERVRGALDLINGGTLLRDAARVGRLRRALSTANFLVENRDRMNFALAYRGVNIPANTAAGTDKQCQQIRVEGKRGIGGDSEFTYFQGPEVLAPSYRWSLPIGTPIAMEFVPGDASGALRASLSDWMPLSALVSDPGEPIGNETVWRLPIRLSNGREFEMGAVFTDGDANRLKELRRDWLMRSDW